MATIRVSAAAQTIPTVSVTLDVVVATPSFSGVQVTADPVNSELYIAADPIITQIVYRLSEINPINHEIQLAYEAVPVIYIPAESFGFSDSIDAFVIGTEYSDTAVLTDVPTFSASVIYSDTATLSDTPELTLTKTPGTDSYSISDSIDNFTISKAVSDTAVVTEETAFTFTREPFTDTASLTDVPAITFTREPFTDSVSVSQNIVLQPTKGVVDSISASDNKYEIGAIFEGDGGLFNSAGLIGSTPPLNKEFALQAFGT
jgi:hypothetical protein